MASTVYAWRPGAPFKQEYAQRCGVELHRLQRDYGEKLTARIVVDEARHPESPLHPCFEWDDVRAGELYREHQARHVIASIRVVHRDSHGEATQERIFVNVTEMVNGEEQRAYVPVSRVLSDAELFDQVRRQFAHDLEIFERRYEQFAELSGIAREAKQRALSLEFPQIA
jgi:hypothetical protein